MQKTRELWPPNRASGRVCALFTATNPPVSQPDTSHITASAQRERTQKVFNAIKKAVGNDTTTPFRTGDISQTLRDGGFPLGSWEVRAELSTLTAAELISLDAGPATWQLTDAGATTEKLS